MKTTKTEDGYDITGFGPNEWTGEPLKESGAVFVGTGFLTFVLCLFLMIFVPPMRDFGVIVAVCTAVAVCAMVATIVGNMRRDKRHLNKMTEELNAFLVEVTGDLNSRLTPERLQFMIVNKQPGLLLNVNGVPGPLEVRARQHAKGAGRIVAVLTPPDYGLESFDALLQSETTKAP